jgi:hypothetical protein
MSKELAPRLEKLVSIDDLIPSMAVRMPTRDVIPMAMIEAVRMVLSKFDLIDFAPSLIFSAKFIFLNLFKIIISYPII